MGEVYRATDTRLGRTVAIKVLPEHLAVDPGPRDRFEREAKAVSSLNHPHICALYDVGEQDGTHYLVMEHVEGETLQQRLEKGRLSLEQALEYAIQIADALDKAHRQGVIHRDLKPGNIMITASGVKLLDFGLAKLLGNTGGVTPLSQMPTEAGSEPLTAEGTILGTLQYMAPEQLEGRDADSRTDIFAFGAVVYEMVTGKKAFEGKSQASLIAAIMTAEATPVSSLQPMSPPALDRVVTKCLAKEPNWRWQTVHDLHDELQWVAAAGSQVGTLVSAAAPPQGAGWRRGAPLALAAMLGALVVGLVAWSLRPPAESRPVTRFNYDLPADAAFRNNSQGVMAFSADGRHFVYNLATGLYLRPMGDLEARLIPGTEAALSTPFFSPNGESVGYWQDGVLKRIAISGGAPVVIANITSSLFGASWGTDNAIFFGQPEGILRVSANGGTPELVIPAEEGEQMDGPQLLPDGESVLFSVTTATGGDRWDQAQIVVQSLGTGERTIVLQGGSAARYVPSGHLVYALGEVLFAVTFDADRVEVSGGPISVVEGVARTANAGGASAAANYAVSDRGALIYLDASARFGVGPLVTSLRSLVWVDRQGREEPLVAPARAYSYPRLSPDGRQVAVDIRDQDSEIWVWNLDRATLSRLTFNPELDRFPTWSPDGRRIAFSSQRDGSGGNPHWRAADGTGSVQRLAEQSDRQVFPTSFSPDGTSLLVYGDVGGSQQDDIGIVSLETEGGVTPLLETTFGERNGEVSPDGRWLAYESDESGQPEIYVRPFPNLDGGLWQVSTGGGTQPAWARTGRELFYRSGDALMAAPVQTAGGFVPGNASVVFEGQYAEGFGGRAYDISPNGQRFLMVKEVATDPQDAALNRFIVVENWFEELRQRVPVP